MLADLELARNHAPEGMISVSREVANAHRACATASKGRLTVRLASVGEAPAIIELVNLVCRAKGHCSRMSFSRPRDIEQLMKQGKFLLVENENEIVGCVYIEPRIEASRLELLAVSPSQQRAGIGSQLMETAERLSSSMHCLFMHLRIMNLDWEALRFCRRRGYVEVGIESLSADEPVSLHCHFVRMFKQLKPNAVAF
jgi:N-acetylglutamate synthase-like GNAT family acetyltransferase